MKSGSLKLLEPSGPHRASYGTPKKKKNQNIQPHLITQAELNDLVRDLDLPKFKDQFLGSRLQQLNFLEKGESVVLEEETVEHCKVLFDRW